MAEIAVTAVITVLCEKLISSDLTRLARSNRSKLKKWKKYLRLIQAVLADASQKHMTEKDVRLWANNLQDLAYDIEDVFDNFATEAMRHKLNQVAHTSQVLRIIPACGPNLSPRKMIYGQKMSFKLDDISTKLRALVDQKNDLDLNVNVERSNITERRLEQTSLVDESKIIGRESDKAALLRMLLAEEEGDENVSILSIVGMAGTGKTTLAKVLYNEEKVKARFEHRAWAYVSEECDVLNISKAIYQAVTGKKEDFANLDLLHVALREKLLGKRFLLVLDEVWNEGYSEWEQLQIPLLVGAPGSRVIVTTRSTTVASVMGSKESYGLDVLSNEDALSLFAQYALGEKNFDKHPRLKSLGKGFVQKCGRLPLALKTFGRILKRNINSDEWEKLLKSEIWNIKDAREIRVALRLSYHHLSPHLKQLFAYCSLFPKHYVFDKKGLVLLWMAEGFLSQSKSMEGLGLQCFEELKSRSFFQLSTNDRSKYTMHYLINDLATSVAGEFFCRLDGQMDVLDTNEDFEKLRHFSLIESGSGSYLQLRELQRATRLRTFLLLTHVWLDNFQVELLHKLPFLRVLRLTGITEVPQSIGNLKYLRYLNFSYTEISCLPEEVGELYNLQSLLVHNCHQLTSLPRSFVKLINLRHLDISDTPKLIKLPSGIGGLTSLQTLPKVMIEEAKGFKISDFKGLPDLQGHLSIVGLDKVINPVQAKDANLHQKKGLEVLKMEWSDVFDNSRNEIIEYKVLEELRPHSNLKSLEIVNNKGTRFPSWLGDPSFDQLAEIKLYGCRSTHLPTLGHLVSLLKLVIHGCNSMTSMKDFGSLPMSLLTSLDIGFCENLDSFPHEHFQSLTSLKELSIQYCPGIEYAFPCGSWPPNLSKLTIGCLNKPMSEWGWQNFPTSLVELNLYGENSGVVSFAVADDVRNATTPSTCFLLPPSLVSLELHDFTDVGSFSEVLQHLPCLNRLKIVSCPKIRDLNTTSGPSNLTITVS